MKKFEVGQVFESYGLYGCHSTYKVEEVGEDHIKVAVQHVSEDDGSTVNDGFETYEKYCDASGEYVVLYEYHGVEGICYADQY